MTDQSKPTREVKFAPGSNPPDDLKADIREGFEDARRVPEGRTAQPGLAGQLALGVEHQLPRIIEGWKANLDAGTLTDEMVDVFVALGWLSSRQDPRLSPKGSTKA